MAAIFGTMDTTAPPLKVGYYAIEGSGVFDLEQGDRTADRRRLGAALNRGTGTALIERL